LNDVIMKIIDIIMLFSPSVSFLDGFFDGWNSDFSTLRALGIYGLTVVFGLFIMALYFILRYYWFCKSKSNKFFKAIAPAQLLAFSTSSSAATLPVTMECNRKCGVDEEVSSFVLPLGATVNGTSLYQAVAAIL
jgi:Na+/H+-dicarboxylate symporter